MEWNQVVAYRSSELGYPQEAPFHPAERFPEYGEGPVSTAPNHVYAAVRQCFVYAGLDRMNYGSGQWNPLGELIRPGDTVLLKPNLVKEAHPRDPTGWRYVLTHGSVVRAVADYIYRALDGRGRIVLADAPQTDSSFTKIVATLGLDRIRDYYGTQGRDFTLVDLRQEEWTAQDGVIVARRSIEGDPLGGIAFDLADASEFVGHTGAGRYYGADYDANVVNYHHSEGRHEYMIAATAIHCDVLFSLPKLKTHKKAGVTVTLKNLVGVNGDKNWLPHHTEGLPISGGDERPDPKVLQRAERVFVSLLRRASLQLPSVGPWLHRKARGVGRHIFGDTEDVIRSGNWKGNDTVWRMCLDLNKIVLYGSPDGTLRNPVPSERKRHYSLVDGMISGEGSGPMNPDPKPIGLFVFGVNAASVDAACTYLMGFDPNKIPIVKNAFRSKWYPLADGEWTEVCVTSNCSGWSGRLPDLEGETFQFVPHFGWTGAIERAAQRRCNEGSGNER
jgi:uncharacterized protein (DUF362 family)